MTPWLHIIGIGEDGAQGLSPAATRALEGADVIIGGDRHHGLAPHLSAERIRWPSPFRTLVDEIGAMSDRQVAVLVTGDPLWFSAGAYLARAFPDRSVVYPQISAYQWGAARLGWSVADLETLTIHGRPAEQIIPYFSDNARLLVLTQDASSPATVARLLTDRGFGPSQMIVLGVLGGENETRIEGTAAKWAATSPDFHLLAIECHAEKTPHPRTGLPDDAFKHDGQITKREVRALTLSALAPRRGAVLWDIGAGSGSVGIEFMRAAPDAQTIAIEHNSDRAATIRENATILGTPRLKIVEARAPKGLSGLAAPDAIFVGGGLAKDTVETALAALKPHGRLVANGVTLESETLLAILHEQYGGTLTRIAVSRAEPLGGRTAWRPMMPITQWIFQK